MKNRFASSSVHGRSHSVRALALGVACFLFGHAAVSRATTLYSVAIDTTAWAGQAGTLAFDLVGGDAASANNIATLGNFATNGTLNNAAGFTLADTSFFNEVLRDITFGTQLSFALHLTENHTAPGFDQFSFFLLDPNTLLPLGATTDPTGADALFAIDITGAAGGHAQVFASNVAGVSWTLTASTQAVPDASSTLPLASCAFGAVGLFRFALRRRARRHRRIHASTRVGLIALFSSLIVPSGTAATATELPDPGKLITVAELEPIVGKISAGPKAVDAPEGAVAREFTLASDASWVTLTIFPAAKFKFEDAKRKFGGPNAVSLPELGKGAFANPSVADIAADLYVAKGSYILEVSLAKGDGAVEKLKAIAKKALPRL